MSVRPVRRSPTHWPAPRPAAGSGLIGLHDRVQALGGSIEVDSRPREGTAIVVELPLQPDQPH
jgi:signal transduction histidine kinase